MYEAALVSFHPSIVDISPTTSQASMSERKSTEGNANIDVTMADARHPKKYPKGPKHPKLPVNDAWKLAVLQRLSENKKAGRPPRSEAELARMIGADKGGLHDLLHTDQASYKYARQIQEVLGVADAMVANPDLTEDEWDAAVRKVRGMSQERQRQALNILRTFDIDDT